MWITDKAHAILLTPLIYMNITYLCDLTSVSEFPIRNIAQQRENTLHLYIEPHSEIMHLSWPFVLKVAAHHSVDTSNAGNSDPIEEGLNCQEIKLTGQMVTTQEIKDENKEITCNVKDNRLIMTT